MRNAVVTATTLLASLAATVVPAAAAPAPLPVDEMVIDVVAANGSGCPLGTADVTVSPDNKAFTVTYSEFTAQAGAGAKPLDFRKNCQLALNVDVPQGFTYAIARTDYRGYARLEKGASATQSSFYYFQGEARTHRSRHQFTGPADGDWQRTDDIDISSVSFLPCGERRFLNVNTELRVNAGWSDKSRATSLLTMDSTDGNLDTVYHVTWKKC
ncbi:hypothetical protein GCM10010112_69430 [Actinoplanes lobatus]|uniref:DUF4360 domain-containing protein n=1 Tax=Actinoplanes lobatus TaxID=113568 RepID=A0A7W7HM70_9ACTN|nr:DUF4360 domain-containing protein [Actinoplanes lobatus]MBB4753080.1 hypothetical protein [Actinoplanes lobatus]GGN87137.1 hypothetical protein GCM10010112_69430 [Actinoplanes lobatus]GIE39687.1 hypothetical protein Alo02nite_25850 [Actinoplanes lobatus]